MYISENAIMLVALGVMFILAALGGVVIGSFFSKLNSITTAPATVMAGVHTSMPIRPSQNKYRLGGHWRSHVFKRAPFETIEDYIAQLNARGIRVTSVTQANGDRYCTVYGEEWVVD